MENYKPYKKVNQEIHSVLDNIDYEELEILELLGDSRKLLIKEVV